MPTLPRHKIAAVARHDLDHHRSQIPKLQRDGEHNPLANPMTPDGDKRMVPQAWRLAMDQG
jgi:hypothetical protein